MSTSTQDLSVTISPTSTDATLLVSIINGPLATRAMDGVGLLFSYDTPPTLSQFEADHPRGTPESSNAYAVLGLGELLGTLVKNGLLNRALVHDMFWIPGMWEKSAGIALGLRERSGTSAMYENFEALATT